MNENVLIFALKLVIIGLKFIRNNSKEPDIVFVANHTLYMIKMLAEEIFDEDQ